METRFKSDPGERVGSGRLYCIFGTSRSEIVGTAIQPHSIVLYCWRMMVVGGNERRALSLTIVM